MWTKGDARSSWVHTRLFEALTQWHKSVPWCGRQTSVDTQPCTDWWCPVGQGHGRESSAVSRWHPRVTAPSARRGSGVLGCGSGGACVCPLLALLGRGLGRVPRGLGCSSALRAAPLHAGGGPGVSRKHDYGSNPAVPAEHNALLCALRLPRCTQPTSWSPGSPQALPWVCFLETNQLPKPLWRLWLVQELPCPQVGGLPRGLGSGSRIQGSAGLGRYFPFLAKGKECGHQLLV